ncbi:MAG: hypothetical protein EA356_09845 [Geminicoccaceae bacterium]|nr:MAG: hypothetical protein EA356_09845 [Geminicoccaceae bacterium]
MWKHSKEMAMRPWGNTWVGILALSAWPALAAERVERPAPLPSVTAPAERPVTRDTDGRASGFDDRGVRRGSDGAAEGSVRPDASGGAAVRDPDGRLRGVRPAPAEVPRYEPRR